MPVGILTTQAANSQCAPLSGPQNTDQTGSSGLQQGSYAEPITGGLTCARVQMLPALTRLQLVSAANPSVTQLGPQEYKVVLSLSGTHTVQLNPSYGNSQNAPSAPVSPATANFIYTSRNVYVATISPTGLVTARNRGECILLCSSVRCANASIPNSATPPAGNTGAEIYCELRVVVLS